MTEIVNIVVVLIGIILLIVGLKLFYEFKEKRDQWDELIAEVIMLEVKMNFEKEVLSWPHYKYVVDGVTYTSIGKIGSDPSSYKVGEKIKIIVNPLNHNDSEILDMRFRVIPVILISIGLIMPTIPFWNWRN